MPESTGQLNEIIVITSPEDRLLIEPILSDVFNQIIHTPQIEKLFNIKYHNPWNLERYNDHGNIIMVSLDYPEDSTADILTRRILAKNKQESQLLILGDLYAKNQLFCIMHSLDAIEFANNMKINSSWILKEFQTLFEEKLFKRIFENGKNNKLSNTVSNILDYTIDLQPDFKLIKSDSINSFIWLGRGYPYRWLILYKAKKDDYINVDSSWIKLKDDFCIYDTLKSK